MTQPLFPYFSSWLLRATWRYRRKRLVPPKNHATQRVLNKVPPAKIPEPEAASLFSLTGNHRTTQNPLLIHTAGKNQTETKNQKQKGLGFPLGFDWNATNATNATSKVNALCGHRRMLKGLLIPRIQLTLFLPTPSTLEALISPPQNRQ